MKKIILTAIIAVTLTSCWPEGCWDCQNVMVDGVISEVCWEVDDSYCQ